MHTQTANKALLRPREVAEMLGVTEQRLAALRLSGGGPSYVKISRSVHYRPQDVANWIESNRRSNTSEAA